MDTRKLSLAADRLTELTTDELGGIVGGPGTHITCYTGITVCGICDPR